MPPHERQRGLELARVPRNIHAEPLAHGGMHEPRAQEQVSGGDSGAHQVISAHHLGSGVRLEGAEYVILGAVRQTIEQQVHAQQQQAPRAVAAVRVPLLVRLARVQREDGDAGRHGGHHEVLVEGVAAPEDGDMQKHDGQQLAALG